MTVFSGGAYDERTGIMPVSTFTISMNTGEKVMHCHKFACDITMAIAPAMEFGDAVLFRIDPELKHRVLPVTGATPKCRFAGWFSGAPGFRHLIRMQSWRE